MEGSAPRRKPHGGTICARFLRPATVFSMNLSALVKCIVDNGGDTHDVTRIYTFLVARCAARMADLSAQFENSSRSLSSRRIAEYAFSIECNFMINHFHCSREAHTSHLLLFVTFFVKENLPLLCK